MCEYKYLEVSKMQRKRKYLALARIDNRLLVREVGEKLGRFEPNYSELERGENIFVRFVTICSTAEVLGIPINEACEAEYEYLTRRVNVNNDNYIETPKYLRNRLRKPKTDVGLYRMYIYRQRLLLGLSKHQLTQKAKIIRDTYQRIEDGYQGVQVSFLSMYKIGKTLEMNFEWMYEQELLYLEKRFPEKVSVLLEIHKKHKRPL